MANKTNSNKNVDVTSLTYQELWERHLDCPINNGADLNSDALLDSLFDDGQYVENLVNGEYVALGFIDGVPARCEYELGYNSMSIFSILKKKKSDYSSWENTIPDRLGDDTIFANVEKYAGGLYCVDFFYRSEG